MRKKLFLSLGLLFLSLSLFFSPHKVKATETSYQDIVINEVVANPNAGGFEWIELFNPSPDLINLNSFTIEDGTAKPKDLSSYNLPPGGYLLLVGGTDFTFILNDGGDTVKLKYLSEIVDEVSYGNWDDGNVEDNAAVPERGQSIARSPNGQDSDFDCLDFIVEISPTAGVENHTALPPPPLIDYPEEVFDLINFDNALIYQVEVSAIVDGDTIKVTGLPESLPSTVRFLYADTPEDGLPFSSQSKEFTNQLLGQTVDLIVSKKPNEQLSFNRTLAVIIFQDKVFNAQLLEQGLAGFYNSSNSILKPDVWLTILQEAQGSKVGIWEEASKITLTELLPDPVGSDAEGEWVEIYNPSNSEVDISYFLLDDYTIPADTIISPLSYLVFHRVITGISLSNSGDTVRLFFPGGLLLSETSYEQSKEGQSFVLIGDLWFWTSQPTPGSANILAEESGESEEKEENLDIPINSDPVIIKTGEFRNFENYLVTISGTVIETSGNTFYLDDGSGQAKVYIQEATGIAKPSMHRGDLFEVTGIVNLYRGTFRILPQKQDDIKLIEAAQQVLVKSSTSKKSTASKASVKKTTISSNALARAPTSKEIAGATNDIKIAGIKSPWWVQMAKVIIGIALILLIILIIQIRRWRYENPRPSDFGDET